MNISEIFIRRPIGTALLVIGIILTGLIAYRLLPVAPLPQVEFPTIEVNANLPGASAETMANSVTTPLETFFASISGVTEMTSSSSLGSTQIVLQFDLNKSIDSAAQDVQTAINAAAGTLPKNMPNPPVFEKTNPADVTMLSLAITSDTLPLTEIDTYAEEFIAQKISQMSGVGLVDFHGEQRPAVRVQVDPDKMAGMGLTLEDVRTMIGAASVNMPKGAINGPDKAVVLDATDQVVSAEAYKNLIVAYRNGAPVRLVDLGSVIDAPEDAYQAAWVDGKRAIVIDIHKQPGYNVLQIIQGIKDRLPQLSAALPAAVHVQIVGDRTKTIRALLADVQITMLLTISLVVMVIFAFLRNVRATLIPALTIPLSLLATFCAMYLLGYSLDNLSMMALTIAVGFIVDDAIVVIENIMRHYESGKRRMDAAIEGAAEIRSTILSMTLSLVAVFIPVFFMGGIVGRLFREFAVTVSVAILMSGLVSLTVTPMMCAWMIRYQGDERHGPIDRIFEKIFDRMLAGYRRGLEWVFIHQHWTIALTFTTLILAIILYTVTPKGFFPQQDTGLIVGTAQASPDISFNVMSSHIQDLANKVMKDPDVDNTYYWIGSGRSVSMGRIFINLKPFKQRHANATQIMARLKKSTAGVPGIVLHMQSRQDIQVGGRESAGQYQYTLQDANMAELTHWATVMEEKFNHLPLLRDVSSDAEADISSAMLKIDRDTASRLGVSVQSIDDALYDAFGQRQIATLFTQLGQYHVILGVDPRFQLTMDALNHIHVRSTLSNQMVPLGMLAHVEEGVSPMSINHQGSFPAITLSFNLAQGSALGDAVTAVKNLERQSNMPATLVATFQGSAREFQSSLENEPWLIAFAIIAVYIVLGILYESIIHPFTIISTLPSAGVGALLTLILFGQDLSIMGMIGIILLIGIVKKNAIMMIDFALAAEREQNLSPLDAIRQGCVLRFRPIMMTTMASLFGALPLAFGTGAGAELRQPLGLAIVGGLIVSQLLTLFATPAVYLLMSRLQSWLSVKTA